MGGCISKPSARDSGFIPQFPGDLESDTSCPGTPGGPVRSGGYQTLHSGPLSSLSSRSSSASSSPDSGSVSRRRSSLPGRAQGPSALEKQRVIDQGKYFRTSAIEREAVIAEFREGPAALAELKNEFQQMIRNDRRLKGVDWVDLLSLRMWTGPDYIHIQNVFEKPAAGNTSDAESHRRGFVLAKGVISALNSLPDSFNYQGTVYTGESLERDWVKKNYVAGQDRVETRFFATSETHDGAWQFRPVIFETESRSGKRIAAFSSMRDEQEVLFPPGTRFAVTSVSAVKYPEGTVDFASHAQIRVRQTEY